MLKALIVGTTFQLWYRGEVVCQIGNLNSTQLRSLALAHSQGCFDCCSIENLRVMLEIYSS
jgi:hypothetical protein